MSGSDNNFGSGYPQDNPYWAGYDVGNSGGSLPTYQSLSEQHGSTYANRVFDGYNEARGTSSSGK